MPSEGYPIVVHSAQGLKDKRITLISMMFKAKHMKPCSHLDILSL